MKPTVFIPKEIKVGFSSSYDSFTGKLAYVIYYDEKGTLRKEKSWNGWRQKRLGEENFKNNPTRGFFINKKTGGYKSGWNFRKSYIRLYDPRGFEFEISVENLVYILEHVVSSPENGLEGEFVYGWDGVDLVLIPTTSEDYKAIEEYNEILHSKDSKLRVKDLSVGGTYKNKNNIDYVYIGRKDIWEDNYSWADKDCEHFGKRAINEGKYHTFIRLYKGKDKRKDFFSVIKLKSPSGKFIQEVSKEKPKEYNKIMKHVSESFEFNGVDESLTETVKLSIDEFKSLVSKGSPLLINEKWYMAINYKSRSNYKLYEKISDKDASFMSYPTANGSNRHGIKSIDEGSLEEIYEKNEIYNIKFYLSNGKEIV